MTSRGILCCCYSHSSWFPFPPPSQGQGALGTVSLEGTWWGHRPAPCCLRSYRELPEGRIGCAVPARPEQSCVQEVRPVGSSNDKHLSGGMKAIELSQELRDNSVGARQDAHNAGKPPTVTLGTPWQGSDAAKQSSGQ